MPKQRYLTVPEDLLPVAEAAEKFFRKYGYKIHIEEQETGFPYTPAFLAKRQATTLVVEVCSVMSKSRFEEWAGFCRSCPSDMRVVACMTTLDLGAHEIDAARKTGIGIYRVINNQLEEVLAPRDLAINMAIPDLGSLPLFLRKTLGSAYENFDRGQWRHGFEDTCIALENEVRDHLWDGLKRERIKIIDKKGKKKNYKLTDLKRLSLGALRDELKKNQNPNYVDSQIIDVITRVNSDRIAIAHGKYHKLPQARQKVSRHVWSIVGCLKTIRTT